MAMMPNIDIFAKGGYVEYVPPSIPSGSYTVQLVPTVVRTVKYQKYGMVIEADVLSDGTIHIDPEAFDMLMGEAGFEKK